MAAMKTTLIALLALGLCLPLGCGKKTNTEESIVGTYQLKLPNGTFTLKLLERGKAMVEQVSPSGVKKPESSGDGAWRAKNGEIVVITEEEGVEETMIFRINPNGTLTAIAMIEDGKREDVPKEQQKFMNFKKIK